METRAKNALMFLTNTRLVVLAEDGRESFPLGGFEILREGDFTARWPLKRADTFCFVHAYSYRELSQFIRAFEVISPAAAKINSALSKGPEARTE
jgi:hypothetical protein